MTFLILQRIIANIQSELHHEQSLLIAPFEHLLQGSLAMFLQALPPNGQNIEVALDFVFH
jgi:hypothetical protein